jgi:hypothetical protein
MIRAQNSIAHLTTTMAFKYSLFVNGKPLGPYERRMIVGMLVKNVIDGDQMVWRDDGVEMNVEQLMRDRDESTPASVAHDHMALSTLGAPSSGMWPQFNVRYGGSAAKPGAWGFAGNGQVSYHGDELRFKGQRRNKNFGMSRFEESLPLAAMADSRCIGCILQISLQPGLAFGDRAGDEQLHLEFSTPDEAKELWELLHLKPGQLPPSLYYANTTRSELN